MRHYYVNMQIPTNTQGILACNVACLYTNVYLYVVVCTKVSLHGNKLTRARSQVVDHLLALLRVPSDKLHRVVYLERYTHHAEAQWLLVDMTDTGPMVVGPAPVALKDKLQADLIEKWDD